MKITKLFSTPSLLLSAAILSTQLFAPNVLAKSNSNDVKQIENTLNDYIYGTSFNHQDQIKRAFSDTAILYLEKKDMPQWEVPIADYVSWFKKENAGKPNGRIGEIISIDVDGTIASAKVEILIPRANIRFADMFLLKKLPDGWKIISKTASKQEANNSGERILFITSSAKFHGDSDYPAGVSYSEVVEAYDTFKKAGYTVDFLSPEGGAVPLTYINTSNDLQKDYLYNPDFMYSVANSKAPNDIDPSRYRAVYYVGGSNAMYGVADNKAIQDIAMEIYEEHNGIVSAVCHGTAGIVNLKTKNGKYLVDGKRISGYPEAYENKSKAYFKHFPFLIQETVEKHGGKFSYAPRNTPFIEADGRVITGQNHLSSILIAEKMIEMLQTL